MTFFLDITHISEAIVSTLSPVDRLNCLLVNHAWHDSLVPIYWRDLVLFRRKWHEVDPSHESKWIFSNNIPLPVPHQALIRNSSHIRALSCNGPSTLSLLASSGCTNLIELCFVTDDPEDSVHTPEPSSAAATFDQQHIIQQEDQGLGQLTQFIACNPNLRAISIENVTLRKDEDMDAVLEFVKSLDGYPSVTGFHIGFREEERNQVGHPDLLKTLTTILDSRLDRIQSLSVRSLQICCGRIRSGQRLVSPVVTAGAGRGRKVGSDLWSEDWFLRDGGLFNSMGCNRSLSILDSNGVLEIVLPFVMIIDPSAFRLRHYPSVRSLGCREMINARTAQFLGDIPIRLPALRDLDMDVQNPNATLLSAFFQDPHLQLSTVSLRELNPALYGLAVRSYLQSHCPTGIPDELSHVLVRLNIRAHLPLTQVLEILSVCPNLHDLAIDGISIDGTEPKKCPPWACQLQNLILGFSQVLSGHTHESAVKTAASFMEQLGQQTLLRDLSIWFSDAAQLSHFPLLDLSLKAQNGLAQLSRLKNLEVFLMMGKCHHIQRSEIEWMAVHWPRLRHMEFSSTEDVDLDGNGSKDHDEYLARLTSYWPTFPKLKIDIVEWY